MKRRTLLKAGLGLATALTGCASAGIDADTAHGSRRRLLLIELKGGNDGLNTVVPQGDPAYYALRPRIAIARDQALSIADRAALHPALAPLLPIWQAGGLAVLQGVGYPAPNLSHFRSIEIWDTASDSDEYRADGWLARSFAARPSPASFAADAVVIGGNDLGPFAGAGARALTLANADEFVRRARLARAERSAASDNAALRHLLKVESDIAAAAAKLRHPAPPPTAFPDNGFGTALATAVRVIANPQGAMALRVTLSGFDTHSNQPAAHARLLGELAAGLVALRAALDALALWDDTLVLTYAEFGRRPKENLSNGTDHGSASVHFALGGGVSGGLYGVAPDLGRLDGAGNPPHALDFRSVYATVLERWWRVPSAAILGARFTPVPFVRA